MLMRTSFTEEQWANVQLLNLACIAALTVGAVLGSRRLLFATNMTLDTATAYRFAIFLGGASLAAFALTVHNSGGVIATFSRFKSRGTSEYGVVRDAIFWTVPAISILALCIVKDGSKNKYWIPMFALSGPLLLQGFFGARRGPTFIIVAAMIISSYFARKKRPPVWMFFGGGAALGVLLLLIVAFRGEFRFGGAITRDPIKAVTLMLRGLSDRQEDSMERALGGNEFVYGANVVLTFKRHGDYYWGRRILTILFIRPIPRQIWPTKYEDVGMERYLVNVGLGEGKQNLMWSSLGAAPGFVADLFAEFYWGAIVASGLIGWAYGAFWRGAIERHPLAMTIYVLLCSFTIFLILQTLEAFVFRLAFTAIPVWLLWKLKAHKVSVAPPRRIVSNRNRDSRILSP
jgi:hypothetical protein